ncbi:MAG: hypothetical protein K2N35_17735, partial [Muribaculaceae bacterium]|nr:hypothetical protein [Muribaculaceae bacterium]
MNVRHQAYWSQYLPKTDSKTVNPIQEKSQSVKVMFSPVDMIYLKYCAKECGLRPAEYVYRAAMNQETTALLTPEERTAVN